MFCRQLYLDEQTSKNYKSICSKFHKQNYPSGIYVLVLSNISGRVEYFDCKEFKQKYYKETGNFPLIIGLAKNASSATNMVQKLIEETYAATGTADVKSYLKEKNEEIKAKKNGIYKITVFEQEGEE